MATKKHRQEKKIQIGTTEGNFSSLFSAKNSARVETVIRLLGVGAFLAAGIISPALPMTIKPLLDAKRDAERKQWKRRWEQFNSWQLKQTLRRLHKQKIIRVVYCKTGPVIALTKKGQTKYLTFQLEDMMIKHPPHWDKKWRMVIYDIAKYKKRSQELFRGILKRLKFLQLQKSVYLTPFPYKNEIEFLRQYFNIGADVFYCVVEQLENDEVFRKYFGV